MKLSHSPLLALVLAPQLHADFDAAKWHFRRQIVISGHPRTAQIVPDRVLYQGSQGALRDIRILRDGVELPYVLETRGALSEQRELPATIRNQSAVPGKGVRFTLDAGKQARHNRVRIATFLHDFKQPVRIETSNDGVHWAIARDDGSIFDVTRVDQPASSLSVEYPESTERFVRVTILGWHDPKSVVGAWLSRQEDRPETRETITTVNSPGEVVDIGASGLPHDQIAFEIAEPAFSRTVEIDSGTNGKDWQYAGQGLIWRSSTGEHLAVSFPEVWDRYLRFRILNHDDHPLTVKRAMVHAVTRSILFPANVAGKYWIYYGNAGARQPVYDAAGVLQEGPPPESAQLRPQERNPDFREPDKPLSDRNPMLLYGLLGVAILVMGYVTVRFLMKVQSAGGGTA